MEENAPVFDRRYMDRPAQGLLLKPRNGVAAGGRGEGFWCSEDGGGNGLDVAVAEEDRDGGFEVFLCCDGGLLGGGIVAGGGGEENDVAGEGDFEDAKTSHIGDGLEGAVHAVVKVELLGIPDFDGLAAGSDPD